MECKFPLCHRHAEANGYCIGHRIYANSGGSKEIQVDVTQVQKKKPDVGIKKSGKKVANRKTNAVKKKRIKQVGKKMAAVKRKLKKAYPPYLEKHPVCAIQLPGCTGVATCVNHTQGRGENEILNEATWEPSCSHCNGKIEQEHGWAEEHGHKKPRHQKK